MNITINLKVFSVETKTSARGTQFTTIRASQSVKDKAGEWQSEWINVLVFNDTQVSIAQNLIKGDRITVDGKLEIKPGVDTKTNQPKLYYSLIAYTIKPIATEPMAMSTNALPPSSDYATYRQNNAPAPLAEDDLPF